jgi:hypothetical protein
LAKHSKALLATAQDGTFRYVSCFDEAGTMRMLSQFLWVLFAHAVNSCKFNIFRHFQRATWQKLAAQSLEVSLRGRQCQHDWLPIQSYPEKSEAFLSQAKEGLGQFLGTADPCKGSIAKESSAMTMSTKQGHRSEPIYL